jgi:hypothetical protein
MTLSLLDVARLLPGDHGGELEISEFILEAIAAVEDPSIRTVLICAPRRSGKTTISFIVALHRLLTVPGAYVLLLSGSESQSEALLTQKISFPVSRSPKLLSLGLHIIRSRVEAPNGSILEVVSSNEKSSVGRTASVVIFDEPRGIEETTFETVQISSAHEGAKVLCIGTPGGTGSWWTRILQSPPENARVIHHRSAEESNPTLAKDFLKNEKKRLSSRGPWGEQMYAREHEAVIGIDLSESPFISPPLVKAAVVENIEPYDERLDTVAVGADLSVSKDASTVAAVARRGENYRLISWWEWDPRRSGQVSFEAVEAKLNEFARRFSPVSLVVDRWQAMPIVQRLRKRHIPVLDVAPTAAFNAEVFGELATVLQGGKLKWKSNRRLEDEILSLEVKDLPSGAYKICEAGRGALHRDLSVSVAYAVWALSRRPKFQRMTGGSLIGLTGWRVHSPSSREDEPLPFYEPEPETESERRARLLKEAETEYEDVKARVLSRMAPSNSR